MLNQENILDLNKYTPIIDFVNKLINDAIIKQVSDIHIEPFQYHYRIRFRRDGVLYETSTITLDFAVQVIMRLKVMAHLNTAEKRLPQDGSLQLENHQHDIRVSTCPTLWGEKIVLRILKNKMNLSIHHLGMTLEQEELFLKKLSLPQGLIIVAGPTGSGKTATLYAALHYLNQVDKNIITIEDPVEIKLAGINQINIHVQIGLSFSHILRALLRQDPDIMMIGEIRDAETAIIALQAAQTGHLVLTTLHANNTVEVVPRLRAMGVSSHYFKDSLSLIISQRLLRKLCFCLAGCNECYNGYNGRTGIFELHAFPENKSLMTLYESSLNKMKQGITDVREIYRILGKTCN